MGREGALHFKELLRQKKMAENLHKSVAGGISIEKAQKMIKRLVIQGPVALCFTLGIYHTLVTIAWLRQCCLQRDRRAREKRSEAC